MPFFSTFSGSFFAGRRAVVSDTGGETGPWTPTSEQSLISWWDAGDGITVSTSGGVVTSMQDKSGNNNTLFASNTPTTTFVNDTSAIDFDGSFTGGNDRMISSTQKDFAIADGNIIIVGTVVIDGVGNSKDSIWSIRDDDASIINDVQLIANNSLQFSGAFQTSGLGSSNGNLSGGSTRAFSGGPYSGNTIHASIFDFSQSDIYGRINGTQRLSISNEYLTAINMSNSTFMIMVDDLETNELDGKFCELMIFNSNDQLVATKAEGYMAHKWGMTSLLPAGHPYKVSTP